MKPRSTETAPGHSDAAGAAVEQLRHGLALAFADLGSGRAELRDAEQKFSAIGDAQGRLVAAAAQVVFIGIADDDYTGFEAAVATINATRDLLDGLPESDHALIARAGALIGAWFSDLDDPSLPEMAQALVRAIGDATLAAPFRCCAGLAAAGYFRTRMDLANLLWVELAMRPLSDDPTLGDRLADETYHLFVQALYECEAPLRAESMRAQRIDSGLATLPQIELKLLLLDTQIALGAGRVEVGRATLARAEPLLHIRAPRPASWWHLLRSRLDLLEGRNRQALTHARLALRLGSESHLPERWMGVTVMQEGQVQMVAGAYADAVPFFERAGRAASGRQAKYCWCLANLAHALRHFAAADVDAGRAALQDGLVMARELAWLNFFRAGPKVAATICALALEHDVEAPFAREVIAERGLQAVRADLSAWPWPIRVRTFGGLQIELNGETLVFKGKVARKPLDLLMFIVASSGSDVSTATAAFALWRELDGDKARAALNIALHRLRKLLGSDEAVLLEVGRLSLNPKLVWVDCLAFEQLVDGVGMPTPETLGAPARAAAERAQALYSGAFLHDTEDEAWQLVYRSRLASKFKRIVTLLAHAAIARGDGRHARALLERGLEFDPLAEDLARDLMRELIDSGEQAAALAVFTRCRDAIAAGLGAKPSAATLALVATLHDIPST